MKTVSYGCLLVILACLVPACESEEARARRKSEELHRHFMKDFAKPRKAKRPMTSLPSLGQGVK
ncbi:MAG: hypothetical protein JKY15_06535 [Deltaproteobacteria bacterium]|nr:hypothetical protein [Deltaproteobacteria bacterium]